MRWGTSSSSKRVKSPKATRLPCPWGDYVAPSWSAIQRDWQRGSWIRGAQTPTHTPSNNRGPNVVLELIFTVHVDRFLVLSRSHLQKTFPDAAAQWNLEHYVKPATLYKVNITDAIIRGAMCRRCPRRVRTSALNTNEAPVLVSHMMHVIAH